ncbi:MAG TPA: IS21 family transposase [Streptosporangiaceae bacterium]|nr:IS21 family transposase [Streptosporangiaceae bacterium]
MDDFATIRQLRREGLTIRQIAEQLNRSPKTILKALGQPEPLPYTRAAPPPAPVFGPFRAVVDAMVAADDTAPRKQRHTAAQVHRRLVAEHGYQGGYDQIRRYLQQQRLDRRDTFIPLEHRPGARAEADFGQIAVDFPDGRQQVPVLLLTWSYSNAPFAVAVPTARTEAVLHGLVEGFHFFGRVPHELWWDNPTTVALLILRGRERALHPRYAALVSHYTLSPKFCMPRAATEKPRVENRVYDLERQWATPVPRVADLGALNRHLRQCCLTARQRICGDQGETVGARFERDCAAALATPARPFDACVLQPGQVDKYQTVRFDSNSYSVPRRFAFRTVTVKGYVDHVSVVAEGQLIATHRRSYGRHDKVLDPLHFLEVLGRKPAALDHAPVFRDWALPAAFGALRRVLEARLGPGTGTRQFIRVLQLLQSHPREVVTQALLACAARGATDLLAIRAAIARLTIDSHMSLPGAPPPDPVAVPLPDLSRFDQLLLPSCPGDVHARTPAPAPEGQPQAAEAADHPGRV